MTKSPSAPVRKNGKRSTMRADHAQRVKKAKKMQVEFHKLKRGVGEGKTVYRRERHPLHPDWNSDSFTATLLPERHGGHIGRQHDDVGALCELVAGLSHTPYVPEDDEVQRSVVTVVARAGIV